MSIGINLQELRIFNVAEQLLIFIISLVANLFSALSGGGAGWDLPGVDPQQP